MGFFLLITKAIFDKILYQLIIWQKPLQYCKVISHQLIKVNGKKINLKLFIEGKFLNMKKLCIMTNRQSD